MPLMSMMTRLTVENVEALPLPMRVVQRAVVCLSVGFPVEEI